MKIAPTLVAKSSTISSVVYTHVGTLYKPVDPPVTSTQELPNVPYKPATTSGYVDQDPVPLSKELPTLTYVTNGTGSYVAISPSIASSK